MEAPQPSIVAFVADLFFSVKIDAAAKALDFQVEWIERATQVAPLDADAPLRQPAEHLIGPGAVLLDKLTLLKPALLIFDLANAEIPWRQWLPLIKSVPATRRIPAICFGSHVDVDTLKIARSCGADLVLPRSKFVADLPGLIAEYARIPDYAGIDEACQAPLSNLALKGLEKFNQGEYFDAHEFLEEAWKDDETPARELYRAILQVAVAYLQIERGNYNGAVKMFLRMRQWIDPLPDECRGVDVAGLRADAYAVHARLLSQGRGLIAGFDRSLFKPVRYVIFQ
jgi:hypothetical protein